MKNDLLTKLIYDEIDNAFVFDNTPEDKALREQVWLTIKRIINKILEAEEIAKYEYELRKYFSDVDDIDDEEKEESGERDA